MELNTADNNSRVIYSIAYKITKYHYSFKFTFLVKDTTQANEEYDIFGPFWVRFGKFTDPPPYLNPIQYKCCSRLRDNVYFEIKVMSLEFVTPPPPPKHYLPTHRLRFKTPLKHLKSQVISQEICLNVYTNASFEWLTKTLVGHCMHTVVVATWTEKKVIAASNMSTTTWKSWKLYRLTFLCRQNRQR